MSQDVPGSADAARRLRAIDHKRLRFSALRASPSQPKLDEFANLFLRALGLGALSWYPIRSAQGIDSLCDQRLPSRDLHY